jgi:hypothetical protein
VEPVFIKREPVEKLQPDMGLDDEMDVITRQELATALHQ